MWVLLQPGDAALVPSPSYPIHIWGPYFAGADARQVPIGPRPTAGTRTTSTNVMEAWEFGWPKPRVVVLSFPHNPTTSTVELADLQRLVDWARERDVVLVHDFAYAETAFDGWLPPSILQCEGAKDVAVELYSMTKSFSMAGWRVAFLVGNREVVGALAKLKSYLDYGTFQPIQIAATVTLDEAVDYPPEVNADLPAPARRPVRRAGPHRLGRSSGRAARCSPGRRSRSAYRELGSIEFAKLLVTECDVAVSPGVGFGARAATASCGSR